MKNIPRVNKYKLDKELDFDDSFVSINRVVVKKLFNLFNYDISFKNPENISILIAPNGCGKTTIFNFLDFIANPRAQSFAKIKGVPMQSFTVYFSNGTKVTISENIGTVTKHNEYNKTYTISYKKYKKSINFYEMFDNKSEKINTVALDNSISKVVLDINSLYCPEIHYTPANRLFLDSISQFLNEVAQQEYDEDEYNGNCWDSFGTLDTGKKQIKKDFEFLKQIKERDIKKRLKTRLSEKINLMTQIFNERNKPTKKTIQFSPEHGFKIFQNNVEIPINCLSSGEKNDFVIFFELIFQPYQFDIAIIDEPEISLHIQWQKDYIDYILKICKINNIQVLLATHSPSIINGHIELYCDKKVELL